jgi:hypothetical protein
MRIRDDSCGFLMIVRIREHSRDSGGFVKIREDSRGFALIHEDS